MLRIITWLLSVNAGSQTHYALTVPHVFRRELNDDTTIARGATCIPVMFAPNKRKESFFSFDDGG